MAKEITVNFSVNCSKSGAQLSTNVNYTLNASGLMYKGTQVNTGSLDPLLSGDINVANALIVIRLISGTAVNISTDGAQIVSQLNAIGDCAIIRTDPFGEPPLFIQSSSGTCIIETTACTLV